MNAEAGQKILRSVPFLKASISSCQMVILQAKQPLPLCPFLKDMGNIDEQSIKFHFNREDFLKWLRTTVGDEKLTQTIDKLDKKFQKKIFLKSWWTLCKKEF